MNAPRALLTGIVDYAGLYPPAGLSIEATVANYSAYRRDPHAWMLGRLVAPADRLEELGRAIDAVPAAERGRLWTVSAVLGDDLRAGLGDVRRFNTMHADRAEVDTVEARAGTPEGVAEIARSIDVSARTYVEIALGAHVVEMVAAIRAAGLAVKIRTGGVTPGAIPSPDRVIHALSACVNAAVVFKATAGLHHPVGGDFALTYEPRSARSPMYGYLNLFLAAAALARRLPDALATSILVETDPKAFVMSESFVTWRGRSFEASELEVLRRTAVSFGSCSFREPVDEGVALGVVA